VNFSIKETYILKVLEASDPTTTGPNEAQLTLLSGVPLDICHNFGHDQIRTSGTSESVPATGAANCRRQSMMKNTETANLIQPSVMTTVSPFSPTREPTTADSLFNLTADVLKLQQNSMTLTNSNNQQHHAIMIEEGLGTSADAFANTAARLMQRHHASCYKLVPPKSEHVMENKPTSISPNALLRNSYVNQKQNASNDNSSTSNTSTKHWKTVKNAVLASRVANEGNIKTNDMDTTENSNEDEQAMINPDQSICDPEVGNLSSSGLSSSSMLRKKKRGKLDLAKEQIQSSAYEFKEWAVNKRTTIETLIKILACIIIILIGISAM
jgi:hypothetical protein